MAHAARSTVSHPARLSRLALNVVAANWKRRFMLSVLCYQPGYRGRWIGPGSGARCPGLMPTTGHYRSPAIARQSDEGKQFEFYKENLQLACIHILYEIAKS